MAKKIKFYFDEMMPRPIARALIGRGYEVIMAIDVEITDKDDDTEHLPFATANDAVLCTRDKPFAGRGQSRDDHAGLICWTGEGDDFGGMIRSLDAFANSHTADEVKGRVF